MTMMAAPGVALVTLGALALAVALAAAAAAVAAVRRRLFVVTVCGRSMEPTYRPGDRVLARRAGLAEVRVGDVVIIGVREPQELRGPEKRGSRAAGRADAAAGAAGISRETPGAPGADWIIKRARALPGDPVPREGFEALAQVPETAVPKGRLVVLGDNPYSADSRLHGYYDGDRLAGVVLRSLGGRARQSRDRRPG